MSGKYVFTKALKELRFQHCQTSDHSNAVRYANIAQSASQKCLYTNLESIIDRFSHARTLR